MTASPSMAAKIKVNSTDDIIDPNDGSCTLREAIIAANTDTASGSVNGECQTGNGADVIVLKDHIYFLSIAGTGEDAAATGDLDILDDLTIIGKGAKKTFINGNKIDRVFHVIGNVKVNINDITIQNGLSDSGGGIYNEGTLTITYSTVSNNSAYGIDFAFGGGIYNYGTLMINKSTVSNNMVTADSPRGGGIYNRGTLTITKSDFSNNSASGVWYAVGGSIYNESGTLTITKSTVSNNSASGIDYAVGGAIHNSIGTLTITKSTVSNNSASGADNVRGGGISNDGKLTITKSTVSNNSAYGIDDAFGGGIYNYGTLTIEGPSSILSNFSSDNGGGLYSDGTYDIDATSKIKRNIPDDIYP